MNIQLHKINLLKWLNKYAPSILLAALFIYVANARFDLHTNAALTHRSDSPQKWLQPASLDESYPLLVGDDNWPFNYANIERILKESKVSAPGQFVIDPETVDLLQKISDELPADLSPESLNRLTFLIEKSLPDSDGVSEGEGEGENVADLTTRYYHYQKDYASSLAKIVSAEHEDQLSLLKTSRSDNQKRQERHFGITLSKALFAKKNITTHYFNDRRIINMDKSLSPAQKKELLLKIKLAYMNTKSHE